MKNLNKKEVQFKKQRVYGIYDSDIKQNDVYMVTSPPNRFYKTEYQTKKVLNGLIDQGVFKKDEVHILYKDF